MRWDITIIATFPEVIRPEPSPIIQKPIFSLPKGSRTEKGLGALQQYEAVGCYSIDITALI